jgi:hypothetical protein
MTKLAKIPDATKEAIRDEYLQHTPINDLAAKYKISTAVIGKWRTDEGWATTRKQATDGWLDDLTDGRKIRVAKLAEDILDQIDRGIINLKNRQEALSVQELEKMTVVFANLHKIGRLDAEKSTENLSMKVDVHAQLSVDKIREIITADVFTAPASLPTTDVE